MSRPCANGSSSMGACSDYPVTRRIPAEGAVRARGRVRHPVPAALEGVINLSNAPADQGPADHRGRERPVTAGGG